MSRKGGKKAAYEKAGRRAETLACWYLRAKGYQILSRRFKTKQGEIDIIARRGDTLVFIEVKQRATREAAEASLTDQAQKRITRTAHQFYARSPALQTMGMRFDLIFVIGRWKIDHIIDAWRDD